MLSARQLSKDIDSLKNVNDSMRIKRKNFINTYFHFQKPSDSLWASIKIPPGKNMEWLPDSLKMVVNDRALAYTGDLKNSLQYGWVEIDSRSAEIKSNSIEWHRKYSISLICLILFFIGAPLGSIIRKGGLGMPLVVAIIMFLAFHLLNMFGEKFVKQDLLDPFIGMWLAVIILTPVAIFFTYKAMQDSQLFNKELYNRLFRKIGLTKIFSKN